MTTRLQRQAQMTRDQQIVTEIQYTLQKDLDNFLGILSETIAVTELVSKADPLYLIHINRLIAQLNLSSSIHYDTQQNCQHNGSDGLLKEQKGVSLKILEEFLQWAQIKPVQEIEYLLNDYKNILQTPQVSINMRNLHKTNTDGLRKDEQLNLQKLIEAMAKTGDDYAKIRNGEQVLLEDKQQLFDKVNRRYQNAIQKVQIYLNQNTNNNSLQNSQQFLGNPVQQNYYLNLQQDRQSRDNNQQQLIKYSSETLHIIKIIIFIIQHSQPNQLDFQNLFDFLREYQPHQVSLIVEELQQLKNLFSSESKIKSIIYNIQVCINSKKILDLSEEEVTNIQNQDAEILNQVIKDDFK